MLYLNSKPFMGNRQAASVGYFFAALCKSMLNMLHSLIKISTLSKYYYFGTCELRCIRL